MHSLITICIPTYKNPDLLRRLLTSISIQTFTDYEIVCTDDTPNNDIKKVISEYSDRLSIIYHQNSPALGSPANWNKAISLARGEWVKIMHGDDWFADEMSLQQFADKTGTDAKFLFSAFEKESAELHRLSFQQQKSLRKNPSILFGNNFIGHPSVIMVHRSVSLLYDENLKWIVDFEYYLRCLQQTNFTYIDRACVKIGTSPIQLTQLIKTDHKTVVSEHIYTLNKLGEVILGQWVVYDAYWRVIRNAGLRDIDQLQLFAGKQVLPYELKRMLNLQRKFFRQFLKIGFVSKILMFILYATRRTTKNQKSHPTLHKNFPD